MDLKPTFTATRAPSECHIIYQNDGACMKYVTLILLVVVLAPLFISPNPNRVPVHAAPDASADTYVVGWGTSEQIAAEVTPFDFTDIAKVFPSTTDHFLFRRKNGSFADWQPRRGWSRIPADAIDNFMMKEHLTVATVSASDTHVLILNTDHTVEEVQARGYGIARGLTDIEDIAAGSYFSVARQIDGDVFNWETGSIPSSWTPIITGTRAIDVRGAFAGAILENGTPVVWTRTAGVSDDCGLKEIPPEANDLVSISIGTCSVVGVKTDGRLVSWGLTAYRIPTGITDIGSVDVGNCATIAQKTDGTVLSWSAYDDYVIQTPDTVVHPTAAFMGSCQAITLQTDGTLSTWGAFAPLTQQLRGVRKISAHNGHYLALMQDRSLLSWGANTYGQSNIPATAIDIVDISAGAYHSLALKLDGTVIAWGANDAGQSSVPDSLSSVRAISAGARHSLALTSVGSVVGWGDNESNQLPKSTETLGQRIISIDASWDTSIVVRADGTLGITQHPTLGHLHTPPTSGNFTTAALGSLHAAALKDNGTVVGWGYNGNGQSAIPATITDVVSIAVGQSSTLALTAHGLVSQLGYLEHLPTELSNVISIELASYSDGDYAFAVVDPHFQTPTPSLTPIPSDTATKTLTPTKTRTPTRSRTPTRTQTPTRTRTSTITPTTLPSAKNLSFESGTANWQSTSAQKAAVIQRIPAIAKDGSWLVVLGNSNKEAATLSQRMYIPPGSTTLTFAYKITSKETCGFYRDTARVLLGTKQVWKLDVCTLQASTKWLSGTVDIRSVAGTIPTLIFEMKTDRANPSTWFVDQIVIGR